MLLFGGVFWSFAIGSPILAQQLDQARRQAAVTIILALVNANHHPLAVDIFHTPAENLGQTHTSDP
jgi:hypothetical protein